MHMPLTPFALDCAEPQTPVLATLWAAFADDSAARTFYPENDEYDAYFPGFVAALGGRAFGAGAVDTYPAGLGAALWLAPGIAPDEDAVMAHLSASLPPERRGRLSLGFEIQSALHPSEPHWYLPWIGVPPKARGAGIGSILLRQGLARADDDGMPCYLEATSRRNAALYARHGFQVTGVVIAPGYPHIIAMRRPPAR
jgi:ribosomal protein S18 acetylase RimI-like enzyme